MRGALVWQSGGKDKKDGPRMGDIVDAVIDKAGVCSHSSNIDEDHDTKRNERGRRKAHQISPRKHRNRPPARITASVLRGFNPFYVSQRTQSAVRRPMKKKSAVTKKVVETKKRLRNDLLVMAGEKPRSASTSASRAAMQAGVSSSFSPTASTSASSSPLHHPFRRLTARKIRSLSKGTTKATTLFRLFKTSSLEGQSRRVKSHRRRCVGEGDVESGEGEAKVSSVFLTSVASVLLQRKVYKDRWHELWASKSDTDCDIHLVQQLLRAFPLFGLVVVVEQLQWQQHCADGLRDAVKVVSSALGVVMHESSTFIGVVLLPKEDPVNVLLKLREHGVNATASDKKGKKFPVGRIFRVAKIFPGGSGTLGELRSSVDLPCFAAKVAPEEVCDASSPFSFLVGRYL